MFIDTINEQYPGRVLNDVTLDYCGFGALFDLPENRKLKVRVHLYVIETGLEVYETAQETSYRRVHLSMGEHYLIDGSESDIMRLLETYLKQVLGGVEHGYEGSFATMLLERALTQRDE